MSDEEVFGGDAGDMGMGDMGMGDDMSEDMDVDQLPEGVQKEILREAPAGSFKTPKTGDEVRVHYVAGR